MVRITIHDLRRTCLSRLAEAGVPPAVLKAYAGHSSITTTMRDHVEIEAAEVLASGRQAYAHAHTWVTIG